ncbi:MAG: ATP-binding cassette domain-containing protein, partial [Anaerolineales bacterium]|nr:ATP-binding cassette domain-containing protein [Anaerolineales bacterium]
MNLPVYSLKEVMKEYNGRRVLRIDALEIQRGEVFVLVGPSGAGKSTLLRLLSFLETPTQGHIRFADIQFKAESTIPLDIRRRVTTVFQRPLLLNRSVRDNVDFG